GRLALYASGFALLLLLHLVPPPLGQLAYGAGLGLFTLFFLGWEYLDYSMERWQFGFGQKRRAALRNAAVFVGFGAGAGLLLLIPLLNLLAIPVCVTGATLLFADLRRGGRLPAPTGDPARGSPP
ncbi:MAG: EI24 domain-containing protein, partial [Deferrisomatales bacterium]